MPLGRRVAAALALTCAALPATDLRAQDRAPAPAPSASAAAAARSIAASPLGACVRKPPEYPVEARRFELEGQTLVAFVVDAEGRAGEPSVLRRSGHAVLDQAALAHLKDCIAQTGGPDAAPLPAGRYALPMVWRLE